MSELGTTAMLATTLSVTAAAKLIEDAVGDAGAVVGVVVSP
jgi:hypothetical protein